MLIHPPQPSRIHLPFQLDSVYQFLVFPTHPTLNLAQQTAQQLWHKPSGARCWHLAPQKLVTREEKTIPGCHVTYGWIFHMHLHMAYGIESWLHICSILLWSNNYNCHWFQQEPLVSIEHKHIKHMAKIRNGEMLFTFRMPPKRPTVLSAKSQRPPWQREPFWRQQWISTRGVFGNLINYYCSILFSEIS